MNACPYTAAIVARHLDGDVDGAGDQQVLGWQPGDFLGDHLRDCASCQRELQQSRRLDAVLAAAAGSVEGEPEELARLLTTALAVATAKAPTAARPRAPMLWTASLAALLVACGFALARWTARPAPPPPAAAPPQPQIEQVDAADGGIGELQAGVAGSGRPSTAILLASPPPRFRPHAGGERSWPAAARSREDDRQCADLLGDRLLADRLMLAATQRFVTCGLSGDLAVAQTAATAQRLRASQALLDAARPAALDAWIRAVAELDAGPVLDGALVDARRRPTLQRQLGTRLLGIGSARSRSLADLALMTTAARLGGREIDSALRQLLRRADLEGELAAALRPLVHRDGRAALLLDIWGDLVARGAGDDGVGRTLFTGQPADCARELGAELQTCRQTPRRLRCLLALGFVAAPGTGDRLAAAIDSPVLPEAHAAAFALAQLPTAQLRPLLPRAARERWLLRAALCCAGVPEAAAWLRDLELTPTELELLTAGRCTSAQFPALAALLRDRTPTTY